MFMRNPAVHHTGDQLNHSFVIGLRRALPRSDIVADITNPAVLLELRYGVYFDLFFLFPSRTYLMNKNLEINKKQHKKY